MAESNLEKEIEDGLNEATSYFIIGKARENLTMIQRGRFPPDNPEPNVVTRARVLDACKYAMGLTFLDSCKVAIGWSWSPDIRIPSVVTKAYMDAVSEFAVELNKSYSRGEVLNGIESYLVSQYNERKKDRGLNYLDIFAPSLRRKK